MNIRKSIVVTLGAVICLTATADDYIVTVAQGETKTLADLTDTSAMSGKRLVKQGLGIFSPGADITGYGAVGVYVQQGVYEATALNQIASDANNNAAIEVADGATLRIGFDLKQTAATGGRPFTLTFGGSGAAGEGGALVFTVNSGMDTQQVKSWTLTSDAVFYVKAEKQFNFRGPNGASPSSGYNEFFMNGHSLTFKSDETSSGYLRFAGGPTFVDPGNLTLDNIRFSVYKWGGMSVRSGSVSGATSKFPHVYLINGAKCNFSDDNMLKYVACVDAAYGTEIGYNQVSSSDDPANMTFEKLVGCPLIKNLSDSVKYGNKYIPTIKDYTARASDLAAGHYLRCNTNIIFSADAPVKVDLDVTLPPATYTVVSATHPITGAAKLQAAFYDAENPKRYYDFVQNEKTLTVTSADSTVEGDARVVCVSRGTNTWSDVTAGFAANAFAGKAIVKLGAGTLSCNQNIADSLSATELVVADGVYEISQNKHLPSVDASDVLVNDYLRSIGYDKLYRMKVTVLDGATLSINADIFNLRGLMTNQLYVTAAGSGVLGPDGPRGAIEFAGGGSDADQFCEFTLADDALFTVTQSKTTFSGPGEKLNCDSVSHYNRFNLNGHTLTFHATKEGGYVRFRFRSRFTGGGSLLFDHCNLTRQGSDALNYLDSTAQKIAFRFENGSRVNLGTQSGFVNSLKEMDFAAGTEIGKVGNQESPKDLATSTRLIGCPSITSDQVITFSGEWQFRKADLVAGNYLDCATNLVFKANASTLSLDDDTNLPLAEPKVIARAPKGRLAGKPRRTSNKVRILTSSDDSYDYLLLSNPLGMMILFR